MDKQLSYVNGDLVCYSCYIKREFCIEYFDDDFDNAKGNTSDAGIVKIVFDIDDNVLGFKCPNCKAIWSVTRLD